MWNLEVHAGDGVISTYEDVIITHELVKSHIRFNKEQAFAAWTQDRELIRALLLRSVGGAPSLLSFEPEGLYVIGAGGMLEGKYFVEQQQTEGWVLATHGPEVGQI
jgi:hypothetical protein